MTHIYANAITKSSTMPIFLSLVFALMTYTITTFSCGNLKRRRKRVKPLIPKAMHWSQTRIMETTHLNIDKAMEFVYTLSKDNLVYKVAVIESLEKY